MPGLTSIWIDFNLNVYVSKDVIYIIYENEGASLCVNPKNVFYYISI